MFLQSLIGFFDGGIYSVDGEGVRAFKMFITHRKNPHSHYIQLVSHTIISHYLPNHTFTPVCHPLPFFYIQL